MSLEFSIMHAHMHMPTHVCTDIALLQAWRLSPTHGSTQAFSSALARDRSWEETGRTSPSLALLLTWLRKHFSLLAPLKDGTVPAVGSPWQPLRPPWSPYLAHTLENSSPVEMQGVICFLLRPWLTQEVWPELELRIRNNLISDFQIQLWILPQGLLTTQMNAFILELFTARRGIDSVKNSPLPPLD